jgi:hypothetical protein
MRDDQSYQLDLANPEPLFLCCSWSQATSTILVVLVWTLCVELLCEKKEREKQLKQMWSETPIIHIEYRGRVNEPYVLEIV